MTNRLVADASPPRIAWPTATPIRRTWRASAYAVTVAIHGRTRRAYEAAVDHLSLPVEAKEDLGDPLLVARLRRFRITLVALEQRQDVHFPGRHRARLRGSEPALHRRGRHGGGLLGSRLR